MTRLRLPRWSSSILSLRSRPAVSQSFSYNFYRFETTSAIPLQPAPEISEDSVASNIISEETLLKLPSPPVSASKTSAKLAALHARLSLPSRLPIETLARTLVDSSADPSPKFNNRSFAVLGHDLLANYTSEYIICQYPRLPMAVVFAAVYAYVGPKALSAMTREWGVDYAAEPGGEVDPGLLQFKRAPAEPRPQRTTPEVISSVQPGFAQKRTIGARVVFDDAFGDLKVNPASAKEDTSKGITAEDASTNFVRAVMGAVYLHCGRAAAKKFYRDHFMSRQLNMANLFQFKFPTRDLNKLLARENFDPPVARIISETGRRSRHPVYVVGVYSGKDKLSEGAGASLDEARTRAAVAALKGWYLYSPLNFRLPSEMEEPEAKPWTPILVDSGDIVV